MQESLFEDGKDPQAFRTIGEVATALDIKPHVLRYWEEQFPMLRPVKRSGGRRYYRPADVELLQTIDRLLNVDGYTIRGAVKALEDGAVGGKTRSAQQPAPPAGPSPEAVEKLRGAVRTLEESTAALPDTTLETPDTAPETQATPGDTLHARLQAIREKLASALIT